MMASSSRSRWQAKQFIKNLISININLESVTNITFMRFIMKLSFKIYFIFNLSTRRKYERKPWHIIFRQGLEAVNMKNNFHDNFDIHYIIGFYETLETYFERIFSKISSFGKINSVDFGIPSRKLIILPSGNSNSVFEAVWLVGYSLVENAAFPSMTCLKNSYSGND